MANQPVIFRAELDLASFKYDIAGREALVTGILKLAPQSPLFASPVMQEAVATLGSTFDAVKAATLVSAASMKQHKLDVAAEQNALDANNKALVFVKALTENGAKSADDVKSMAFRVRAGKLAAPPLIPPDSIDVTMGRKGHGKVKVAAHETGGVKRKYAVEMSPDPVTPTSWTSIPGSGRARRVSGKSGTSAWVRFALVYRQQQSDWSVPVLITFP